MENVVITGAGVFSALGNSIDELWNSIRNSYSGIERKYFSDCVGEVLCAPIKKIVSYEQCIYDAVKEALDTTDIRDRSKRWGLIVGTAAGEMPELEKIMTCEYQEKQNNDKSEYVSIYPYHGIAEKIKKRFELNFVYSLTISAACASSNIAILHACQLLKDYIVDKVIVVGVDFLSDYDFLGFRSLGIMSDSAIRPFDVNRSGIVLGEACAALVLERDNDIHNTGHWKKVEIVGGAISNEAYNLATPDPDAKGAVLSMEKAMYRSGITASKIDYINAHGTGTKLNDLMEAKAIHKVFGEKASIIPISSSKSMTGHTRGASGAIEAIICILALQYQIIPATINHLDDDPEININCVANQAKEAKLKYVMSNSFGFGGHCASIIFLGGD